MMSLVDAMGDAALFGAHFPSSWDVWRVVLKASFGLPMSDDEGEVFRKHTGRMTPPTQRAREVYIVAGRRSGKSRISGLIACYLAACADVVPHLAPGERATIAVIAADRLQARTCFRYICGLFDSVPLLRRLVTRRTASALDVGRVTIEVHTSSFRSTRGYTYLAVIGDELAFWKADDSASPDVEVLAAVRPGLATLPGAMLIGISSPYSRRGALWTAYTDHYGKTDDPVLVWKSDTESMNPSVDRAIIAAAYEADEASARAEYGGEFRSDLEAFVSRETLAACVVPGRAELPPMSDTNYVAFVDPSGGSADSFTCAIGHSELQGDRHVAVVDFVREVLAPFNPSEVVGQLAEDLGRYGVSSIVGDRYAGSWPSEAFSKQGVAYNPSSRSKSELYLHALPQLNAHAVELPDHKRLQTQLLTLERRTTRGGKDSVDHAPNGRDDIANAVAGLVCLLAAPHEAHILSAHLSQHQTYRSPVGELDYAEEIRLHEEQAMRRLLGLDLGDRP